MSVKAFACTSYRWVISSCSLVLVKWLTNHKFPAIQLKATYNELDFWVRMEMIPSRGCVGANEFFDFFQFQSCFSFKKIENH